MPERIAPQEHIDYILGKLRESSDGYDLKELMHVSEKDKMNWLEVWTALDTALERGLVKPLELDETRRPYVINKK